MPISWHSLVASRQHHLAATQFRSCSTSITNMLGQVVALRSPASPYSHPETQRPRENAVPGGLLGLAGLLAAFWVASSAGLAGADLVAASVTADETVGGGEKSQFGPPSRIHVAVMAMKTAKTMPPIK